MVERDTIYLKNILDSITNVETYVKDYDEKTFLNDSKTFNACIRMFEIMGEATKRLSTACRQKHHEVRWKEIAGLRDILIHDYEGVDLDLLWQIIKTEIPLLKQQIQTILKNL